MTTAIHKSDKDISTKENILRATLLLIKDEGFEHLTTRKIASIAGVNISLVNYYFGSKEKLLNEALRVILDKLNECFIPLDDESLPPKERLHLFLLNYIEHLHQYPKAIWGMISQCLPSPEAQFELARFLHATGFKKVQKTIQEITANDSREENLLITLHLFCAVFLPILAEPVMSLAGQEFSPSAEKQIEIMMRFFSPLN